MHSSFWMVVDGFSFIWSSQSGTTKYPASEETLGQVWDIRCSAVPSTAYFSKMMDKKCQRIQQNSQGRPGKKSEFSRNSAKSWPHRFRRMVTQGPVQIPQRNDYHKPHQKYSQGLPSADFLVLAKHVWVWINLPSVPVGFGSTKFPIYHRSWT